MVTELGGLRVDAMDSKRSINGSSGSNQGSSDASSDASSSGSRAASSAAPSNGSKGVKEDGRVVLEALFAAIEEDHGSWAW